MEERGVALWKHAGDGSAVVEAVAVDDDGGLGGGWCCVLFLFEPLALLPFVEICVRASQTDLFSAGEDYTERNLGINMIYRGEYGSDATGVVERSCAFVANDAAH